MAGGAIRQGWQGLPRDAERPPCPGGAKMLRCSAESPGKAVDEPRGYSRRVEAVFLPCHTILGRGDNLRAWL